MIRCRPNRGVRLQYHWLPWADGPAEQQFDVATPQAHVRADPSGCWVIPSGQQLSPRVLAGVVFVTPECNHCGPAALTPWISSAGRGITQWSLHQSRLPVTFVVVFVAWAVTGGLGARIGGGSKRRAGFRGLSAGPWPWLSLSSSGGCWAYLASLDPGTTRLARDAASAGPRRLYPNRSAAPG